MLASCLTLAGCQGDVTTTPNGTPAAASTSSSTSLPAAVALSGSPATTVTAGTNYVFTPTVTAGGGTITFSVAGLPAWATFDSATGTLSGKPATSDEGTTAPITITAANSDSNAQIGPFTVQVSAPAATSASVTLDWVAPTTNVDGSPITGLAGFHIYYGTSAQSLSTTVTITDPTLTTVTVNGLTSGTYYFTIVAYNTAGEDSSDSNVASKTI